MHKVLLELKQSKSIANQTPDTHARTQLAVRDAEDAIRWCPLYAKVDKQDRTLLVFEASMLAAWAGRSAQYVHIVIMTT